MSSSPIVPVILCGGAGARLWPLSREAYPKQFLPLIGDQSTFENTLERISDRSLFSDPIILTAEPFRFLVRDQLARHNVRARVVLEPSRRDSGPAVGLAAELVQLVDRRAILYVMAADHLIDGREHFLDAARRGRALADDGFIVTFGIQPTQPATGYGYIRLGEPISDQAHRVDAFVEKPDAETAERYVTNGYLWNSGNFMFRADLFADELRRYEPEMAAAVRRAAARVTTEDLGFERIDPEAFSAAPAKSVDYAVMERTDRLAVMRADYKWSDLGGWEAIWEQGQRDADRNVTKGPVVLQDTTNSLVSSEGMLTAVSGLDGVCVVVTDDAVFVSRRDAPEMKRLVAEIRRRDPAMVDEHRRVHRPWGWYQSVDRGERFQVKRICVKPGGRLSLQRHYHRSEHWVVVRGTAQVTVDDEIRVIRENESVYLPLGATHRLENPGKIPLELIEVQSGSYLGEDDIVRIEDDFGRSQ